MFLAWVDLSLSLSLSSLSLSLSLLFLIDFKRGSLYFHDKKNSFKREISLLVSEGITVSHFFRQTTGQPKV